MADPAMFGHTLGKQSNFFRGGREDNVMNEFLKSMRANKEKQRRRGGYNPQYSQGGNPQYRNENSQFRKDNGNGNGKRGNGQAAPSDRVAELLNETLPALKSLMETMTEHQRSIIDTGERRADAEERRARAMESIAESLQYLVGGGTLSLPEADRPVEVRPALAAANRPDRDSVLSIIFSMRDEGATYGQIAAHLDSLHIPTFSGKGRWHAQTVHRVCKNRS
jgi:hypothetical protein